MLSFSFKLVQGYDALLEKMLFGLDAENFDGQRGWQQMTVEWLLHSPRFIKRSGQ